MREKEPAEAGLVNRVKASRIGQILHRINLGRYEEHVPLPVRLIAERYDLPKPNNYVPAAADQPDLQGPENQNQP